MVSNYFTRAKLSFYSVYLCIIICKYEVSSYSMWLHDWAGELKTVPENSGLLGEMRVYCWNIDSAS